MRLVNRMAPAVVAAGLLFGGAADAGMSTTIFSLSDHPDGNANPPGYGLRFDNIFTSIGGAGGVTTFSMDFFGDTTLTVTDNGIGGFLIDIAGTLYGGVDTGVGYGFGEGAYALEYTYAVGVLAEGGGWIVDSSSLLNGGTLTALAGNADIAAGEVFTFLAAGAGGGDDDDDDDEDGGGSSFVFKPDGHRLNNHAGYDSKNMWVGRGWHWMKKVKGTHDFLFVAEVVPTPGAAILLAGGGLLGATRRRR